jgi:hypothetical protein
MSYLLEPENSLRGASLVAHLLHALPAAWRVAKREKSARATKTRT